MGGPVHPTRQVFGVDKALGLPALYSAARLIADSVASLPLKIYTTAGGNSLSQRYTGPSIFDMPSAMGTIYDWLFTMMSCLILHGNAWGLITGRDGYGFPTGIEWIPPELVTVIDDEMQPWNPLRSRIYVAGRLTTRDELFHVKAFSLAGRIEGISPLRQFALTILQGVETQKYATDWFANGGFPIGTFQNNELEVDRNEANELRAMLTETLRTRQPLVFGRDWEYKPVVVPPEEAQFIQAMQLNATQIASVYGLPPDRIGGTRGDSLTYNTVEQSTLQVIEALRPWLVRLETAFSTIIPAARYVRFNADALLKTDLQTRTSIYKNWRDMGLRTIDELRDLEDLPPMGGNVGNEAIPLEVMVAMSRSIRGIPKTMIDALELEMDMAVDRIQQLQAQGIAQPDMEPAVKSSSAVLAGIIGDQGRSMSRADAQEVVRAFIREYGAPWMANTVRSLTPKGTDGPEYLGPWIPSERELARLTAANGNGNGHGGGH